MIVKILIGSLLALSTVSAVAGELYIYKSKDGRALLTNVSPSGSFDKPAKVVANEAAYLSAAELKVFNEELDAEVQALKDKIKIARSELAKQHLKNIQKERKKRNGVLTASNSEEVYTVPMDDSDSVDIGAKIGMTKEQVLNKTYWGKPIDTHEVTDEYGKLELLSYRNDRGMQSLYFENNKLILIHK